MNKPCRHDPCDTASFNTASRQELFNIDDGRMPKGKTIVTHDPTAPRNGDGHDYRHFSAACDLLGIEDTSELRLSARGMEGFIPDVRESIGDLELYSATMETYGDRYSDDPETLLTMEETTE